jgi:hypothetical protein
MREIELRGLPSLGRINSIFNCTSLLLMQMLTSWGFEDSNLSSVQAVINRIHKLLLNFVWLERMVEFSLHSGVKLTWT